MASIPHDSILLSDAFGVIKRQKKDNTDYFNANASLLFNSLKDSAELGYSVVISREHLYDQGVQKGVITDKNKELIGSAAMVGLGSLTEEELQAWLKNKRLDRAKYTLENCRKAPSQWSEDDVAWISKLSFGDFMKIAGEPSTMTPEQVEDVYPTEAFKASVDEIAKETQPEKHWLPALFSGIF